MAASETLQIKIVLIAGGSVDTPQISYTDATRCTSNYTIWQTLFSLMCTISTNNVTEIKREDFGNTRMSQ